MKVAWVLGSGGLLGSALCRALHQTGTKLFFPFCRLTWSSETDIAYQITKATNAFAASAAVAGAWEVYWAAGVSTMNSSLNALEAETRILLALLSRLKSTPDLQAMHGAFAFASSAGAIYAGSSEHMITETASPAPTTPYAWEKLKQEDIIRSFVQANDNVSALIARFSTLYGPGQAFAKPQGLITKLARLTLKNEPVPLYVPFDTIRDYITSDDAAVTMVAALRENSGNLGCRMKIIASEQPTTIAEIVATFKKLARRSPRIIFSAAEMSRNYPRQIRFQSNLPPLRAVLPKTSLLIGIGRILAAERVRLMRS